jgi:hypothetical protein
MDVPKEFGEAPAYNPVRENKPKFKKNFKKKGGKFGFKKPKQQ